MTTALQQAAADNEWFSILPEIALVAIALLLLVQEIIFPKHRDTLVPATAIFGQAAVLAYCALTTFCTDRWNHLFHYEFNRLLHQTETTPYFRLFIALAALLTTLIALPHLRQQNRPRTEFLTITLIAAAAMMLLTQANNLLLLFVALETVTIAFYVLVAYNRHNPRTLEAALKYLVTAGLSSAILLFGIVLLYGAAGTLATGTNPLDYQTLQTLFQQTAAAGPFQSSTATLATAGLILTLCGAAFKIAAVPFQIWVPDVYQGAPTPTTAFLATASKAAGFAMLVNLLAVPFAPAAALTTPLLAAMAIATILFGNLAALTQHNIKRLIGLSGVAHAGYLLIAVTILPKQPDALPALEYYLATYLLATMAILAIATQIPTAQNVGASLDDARTPTPDQQTPTGAAAPISNLQSPISHLPDDTAQTLSDYHALHHRSPFLAGSLTIALASLAGIPPLAGFMGKLLIFIPAFRDRQYLLLAIAIIGVTISVYYYFGWIKTLYQRPQQPAVKILLPLPQTLLIALLSLLTIALGIYPALLTNFLK